MLVRDRSIVASDIQQLGVSRNVSFKVCAVTMQRFAVDKSQLITGVE